VLSPNPSLSKEHSASFAFQARRSRWPASERRDDHYTIFVGILGLGQFDRSTRRGIRQGGEITRIPPGTFRRLPLAQTRPRQGFRRRFVSRPLRGTRYRHLQDLGNLKIATGGKGVQIKNPAAVSELLELALQAADVSRRVIFYCACEFPSLDGALACHRRTIADLVLAHAKKRGRSVSVVEWPVGNPGSKDESTLIGRCSQL